MKIVISTLVSSGNNNGLTSYIRYLLIALQKYDAKNEYFILVNKNTEHLFVKKNSKFKKIVVRLPHYPRWIMRPLFFLWHNFWLNRLLKNLGADVYHTLNPVPMLRTFSIPCIVTIHDLAEHTTQRFSKLRQVIRRFANISSANKADHLLTVSDFSKNEIMAKLNVPVDKISSIYPGVTLDVEKALSSNDILGDYFLHIGGGRPNKNVNSLINAFLDFRNKHSSVKLIMVGEKYWISMDKSISEQIIILKNVEESVLTSLYQNALALVYPSFYEGFGLPIIEAMSLGTPVITSDRASMSEVSGGSAILIDPEDSGSILSAMNRIYENKDLKLELSDKGKKRAEVFNWGFSVFNLMNLYSDVTRYQIKLD